MFLDVTLAIHDHSISRSYTAVDKDVQCLVYSVHLFYSLNLGDNQDDVGTCLKRGDEAPKV